MESIVFSVLISLAGVVVQILISQIIVRRATRKAVQDEIKRVTEARKK